MRTVNPRRPSLRRPEPARLPPCRLIVTFSNGLPVALTRNRLINKIVATRMVRA
jgi:hypothetical protein